MHFTATLTKGQGLGKKIGYPTINLVIPETIHLDHGVYGCTVYVKNTRYRGILYFGPKTVLENLGITLEVNILDPLPVPLQNNKIQGKIRVTIGKFIRKPQTFQSATALKHQIQKDIRKLTGDAV